MAPKYRLQADIREQLNKLKPRIEARLLEFASVPQRQWFYELCFCLCTPQSRAANAWQVQQELERLDFYNKTFDPVSLLRRPETYIRFHNQKGRRLLAARYYYPEVEQLLSSKIDKFEKRDKLVKLVNGYGYKEASHFMRNIGYRGLSILDRHILKHMLQADVYKEIPKVSNRKQYLAVEEMYFNFAKGLGIDPDVLDILFWSYESGEILK